MRRVVTRMLTVAILFSVAAAAAEKGKTVSVKGWVSDTMCAAKGDKKCANKEHLKQGGQAGFGH